MPYTIFLNTASQPLLRNNKNKIVHKIIQKKIKNVYEFSFFHDYIFLIEKSDNLKKIKNKIQ